MDKNGGELKIEAGMRLRVVEKLVTQEMINQWAKLSGDFNPLHIDPQFGKKTLFGTNIAHGPLILSFIIEALAGWFGKYWLMGGKLENCKIRTPVPPGSEFTIGAVITKNDIGRDKKRHVKCDVFARHKDERLIVSGNAVVEIEVL